MNGQTIRDVAVEESEVDQSYPETVPVFMEADYLAAHPDVAEKVAKGEIASGQVHYEQFGKKEGRRLHAISERANIDALLCSPSGSLFVIGWAEESASPLRLIRVATSQATLEIPAGGLVRFRRPDVENVLSFNGAAHFGLCGLAQVKLSRRVPFKPSAVTLEYENGSSVVFCPSFRTVEDPQLLEIVLGYLSNSAFCGNPQVELMFALDGG
ncbi:MAG: hypothetical protein JO208_15800, partial [Alphaproteobacteria bacterium]|nr:hypothetical protein [Alphaproteobacteria bacterium]